VEVLWRQPRMVSHDGFRCHTGSELAQDDLDGKNHGLAAHDLQIDLDAPCLVMDASCRMFRRNSHNYQIDIIASFFAGRPVFSRLIYPVPVPGGLGIHVTLDLAGRMRFGPDVQWTDGYDYEVEPARAASFYPAIRTYWPALPDGSLVPDYSGIRPKLSGPGEPPADFIIDGPAEHGLAGLVHLFGIESPGLTASLSIAEQVVRSLAE
jgi:hypothetical protein